MPIPHPAPPALVMNLSQEARNAASWDTGAVGKTPVARLWTVKNASGHAITLTGLTTSCRCTTAEIVPPQAAPQGRQPLVIAPGASVTFRVTLAPAGLPPGPFDRYVLLLGVNRHLPVAQLHVAGIKKGTR